MVRRSGIAWQGGPSATAEWLKIKSGRSGGRDFYALPAAEDERGGTEGARRPALYVIAAPALAKVPITSAPLLSLTLVLSRPPNDCDETLASLVTGGVLALSLTVLPTPFELRRASIAADQSREAVPLFVRRSSWALVDMATGEEFASATLEGNGGDVALSQTVTRELALSLLAALQGGDSGLLARCDATFRAVDGSARRALGTGGRDYTAASQTTLVITTNLVNVERSTIVERPLVEVFKEAVDKRPLDAIVSAVCPASDGTLQPIGQRMAQSRDTTPTGQSAGFAVVGDSVAAMPAVLRTSSSSRISAHALAASDLVKPSTLVHHWEIHDLVLHTPAILVQDQHLPVIEADTPLWPDRIDTARFWYAPEFSLVDIPPTATAPDAPFLFSFAVVGHDQQGRPGLEAKVHFALRMGMSPAAQAEWESRGRPQCDPVPTNGLSLALEVPFRDENSATATQTVNSTDLQLTSDRVVVTFTLTDQWARLAYGALGTEGFQTRPARLNTAYVFPAYVPVSGREMRVQWGGKAAMVGETVLRKPVLAASAVSLNQPVITHAAVVASPVLVTHHPVLTGPLIAVPPKTYGIRTQGRTGGLDVFVPCGQFGALYVQTGDPQKGEADQAIGCRDAWTLGQIRLRLYEQVDIDLDAPDPGFTVFRSAQVPGRFLVLPKTYTITRFEPDDARAYRPAIYLYSNVDAVHPERTTCILMATLRPAVTPADRRALVDALRTAAHPDPTLEWPTELSVEPRYTWAIPSSGSSADIAPAVAKTPEGFQVSLATGVDRILQLKAIVETSGLAAGVTFELADGTTLQSTLSIDLRRIDGPWEAGAIAIAAADDRATLANPVERAADVQDVLTYAAGIRTGTIEVERRLEPAASLGVTLPQGADEAVARYKLVNTPASLEEIRTFIEDIYTNVVFVCLFNLADEHVERVSLEGRISGIASAATGTIDAKATSAEMAFVLPLTVYLSQPTLQYRVTFVMSDGAAPHAGPWRDWRLDLRGNVVEIGKDDLQEG